MNLFRFENYNIEINPEALALKPFKKIWSRDSTKSKTKALQELSFIYFFCDPRSDYQYITDDVLRTEAIVEGEGLPEKWKPDKLVQEAMEFYCSFKSEAALLLEDTRLMVSKFREKLKSYEVDKLNIKELKDLGMLIKQIPEMIKDLNEAEKVIKKEVAEQGRMRGSGEKTIFEDDLNI